MVEGRLRPLLVVRRPSRLLRWAGVVVASALVVAIAAGRGGSEDGTAGAFIAMAVLLGGAIAIQRIAKPPTLIGFDPEGVYSPRRGWIEWVRVRRIEVRGTGNWLTGRRTVVWLAYQPDEDAAKEDEGAAKESVWLAVNPGWPRPRTLALATDMERHWRDAIGPSPAQPGED